MFFLKITTLCYAGSITLFFKFFFDNFLIFDVVFFHTVFFFKHDDVWGDDFNLLVNVEWLLRSQVCFVLFYFLLLALYC